VGGEIGARGKLKEREVIGAHAAYQSREEVIIGSANKGSSAGNPELGAVIVALKHYANVRLPTPTDGEEGKSSQTYNVEPQVTKEGGGRVEVEIAEPDGVEDRGTDVGSWKMAVDLTSVSGNFGVEVANAGDSDANLIFGEGVQERWG